MATKSKSGTPARPARKSAKPAKKSAKNPAPASTPSQQPPQGVPAGTPIFADPRPTPDPTKYTTPHASDTAAYNEMDALIKASKFLPLPFPAVVGVAEPILKLADALGSTGASTVEQIGLAGQMVFHCAGDTGATKGPKTENEVVDKMLADFTGEAANAVPQFFYNLGDIVYSFGEHKYYYDQFYDAFRDYPRPIFAIPGNHDGIVLPPPAGTGLDASSLSAFLANFCAPGFAHSPDAVGISRTTMIQPGVYFTLDTPLVRILGIYSNMLENPGVISSTPDPTTGKPSFPQLSDVQLDYLTPWTGNPAASPPSSKPPCSRTRPPTTSPPPLTIDPALRATGTIVAKQSLRGRRHRLHLRLPHLFAKLSGLPPNFARFEVVSHPEIFDGVHVKKGQAIAVIRANAASILSTERVILNLMQRMSGIATLTNEYVRAIAAEVTVEDQDQDQNPRHPQDHPRPARAG
jgi:hypothetical protein